MSESVWCPDHGTFFQVLRCPHCLPVEHRATPPESSVKADRLLRDGADAIADRADSRDTEEERSMARTVNGFWAIHGANILARGYMTEEEGWQFMVNLKQSRAAAGGFVEDDYADLSAYGALAGECASQERSQ